MHLGDHCPAPILESFDHPQFPEGLASIEGLREDAPGEIPELISPARRWQRRVPDVIQDLKMRIVDPHRPGEPDRRKAHLLPVARHQGQLGGDQPHEVSVRGCGPLEDGNRPDMHGVVAVLDMEERRVLRTHHIHVMSLQVPAVARVRGPYSAAGRSSRITGANAVRTSSAMVAV